MLEPIITRVSKFCKKLKTTSWWRKKKDHHMHKHAGLTLLPGCCFFFLRSVFLWGIHFDLPSFFSSFWNSEKLPSNKFSLSLLLCLSSGRPTQSAQRWQNLLGRLNLALCVGLVNLWEYLRTEWESNLWLFPFGSFDSRTSGGWMGGARSVLEPSKIRFFAFFLVV